MRRKLRYLTGITNHRIIIGTVGGDENGQEKRAPGLYGYADSDSTWDIKYKGLQVDILYYFGVVW